ncbi:MAG: hypothetical protein PHN44_01220 [Candidatus Marinimicrobia bacterium]|nr:hypothetical protein [Candidatus Neomarinimicrobiota bacterium]MDD5539085.1 hypothetical protein [Candidatus Neomarinimicrobiota bacterium]
MKVKMESNYFKSLVTPMPAKAATRRVKSFDVDMLVQFGYAQNAVKNTNIPLEALGAPYRLAIGKDGEVKFSASGRPSIRVAKEIVSFGTTIHQNVVAQIQAETARIFNEQEETINKMMEAAKKVAMPIINSDVKKLDDALAARAKAEAEAAAAVAEAETIVATETTTAAEKHNGKKAAKELAATA